jgi:hypothetical protein
MATQEAVPVDPIQSGDRYLTNWNGIYVSWMRRRRDEARIQLEEYTRSLKERNGGSLSRPAEKSELPAPETTYVWLPGERESIAAPPARLTPHMCSKRNFLQLLHAVLYGPLVVIDGLVTYHIPIDTPDALGRTVLMAAVAAGHKGAVVTLLRLGADPNHLDSSGHSVMHYWAHRHVNTFMDMLASDRPLPYTPDYDGVHELLQAALRA